MSYYYGYVILLYYNLNKVNNMLVELNLNFDVVVLKHCLNHESNIIWPRVLLSFNANAFNIPWYDFVKKIITFARFTTYTFIS